MNHNLKSAAWISLAIALLTVVALFFRREIQLGVETDVEQRRLTLCETLLLQMRRGLEMYYMQRGEYPPSERGGLAVTAEGNEQHRPYFMFQESQRDDRGRILDPWGRPFRYLPRRVGQPYSGRMLYSMGPNGVDEYGSGDDLSSRD